MNTIGLFNQPQGNVADKFACRVVAVAASSSVLAFADAHAAAHQTGTALAYNPSGKSWSQMLPNAGLGNLLRG